MRYRSHRPRRAHGNRTDGLPLAIAASVLVALVAMPVSSCSERPTGPEARVEPLTQGDPPSTPSPLPTADDPPAVDEAAAPVDPARVAVEDSLDRYGRALSDLAARPAALDDPSHPAAVAWDAAVVAGSALTGEITTRIRTRAADGVVVVPPEGGDRSFVHHPIEVTAVEGEPDRIAFTWCGWSPGIGRRADGSVVDDSVAHARGTGTVQRVSGTWKVATLDQTEVDLLPPGAPDPCPDRGPGR